MSGKLKEVRERIASVNSTKQITSAMKMVSAAKLRRAQQAIVQIRPYSEKLDQILKNVLSNLEGDGASLLGKERPVANGLVVVITSNRGLAGAFNSNIIKEAVEVIDKRFNDVRSSGNLSILCIGKKGYDYFRKRYQDCNLINDHVELFSDLSFEHVATVSQHLIDTFMNGTYDSIYVSYGRFKNAATQFPEIVRFLPVDIEDSTRRDSKRRSRRADYIFEPDQEQLLSVLIPTILQTSFHKFILDTHASEHGARMTAMDKATENADEMLKDLRITYNKARQEAITKELSEIVGGAAALDN
jgi:F-type H+-transporting ATPase subunit gamma